MHEIIVQSAGTNTWLIAAIGALGAIFGALAGGLATYIIEKLKIKNQDLQRRQQAYSQLNGRRRTYVQYCVSYFMNFIALEKSVALTDFGLRMPQRITLNGQAYSTSVVLPDSKISMMLSEKSDEIALKLAQSRQDVWEIFGLIKLLFANTEDKIKDIEDFDHEFETLESEIIGDREGGLIEFQFELLPNSHLNITTNWVKNKETKLRNEYVKVFDEKFDVLLDYLKLEIQREQGNAAREHGW